MYERRLSLNSSALLVAKGGSDVRVVFLGGLGEIGRNCACLEVEGRIIVIDVGLMFPEPDMPGVDLVLPDLTYLRENADRVDGIVLTHGHEDHIGGLSYLLRDLSAPIYGAALTVGLAANRVREAGLFNKAQFIEVADGERITIGPCDVEFIPVTHSVPSAFAIAFHTPQGVVLHSGDFKIDLAPVDGRRTDLARIGEIVQTEGIRLLLADSTNAEEAGFTPSETTVGETLRRVFLMHPEQRLIVACFASHLHRIQQIVDAAVLSGRRIATLGRSMKNNVELARRLGILTVPHGVLIDITEIDDVSDSELCILSTGSQGEPMAAMSLMASGQSKWIDLGPGDVVILSAHPIPGNEWSVGRVIDELHRRGAEVIHSAHEDVHVSGHARRGELSVLLSVAKPDCFVPVHGEYRHLLHHAQLAESMGVAPSKIVLAEDGDIVNLNDAGIRKDGTVPAGYLYVDGAASDIDHGILRDRKVLASEGMVMVVASVDIHDREIAAGPVILTRGWVGSGDETLLSVEAAESVAIALKQALSDGTHDVEGLNRVARKALGRFVGTRMRQKPMIVPVIVSV
jgi:ribonuclease J